MQKNIDFNQVKADAIGKWPGIFQSFGIVTGDGLHGSCPACGGKDRFRFDDIDGRGTYICGQCGAGDGISLLMKVLNCDVKEVFESVAKVVGTVPYSKSQPEPQASPESLRKLFFPSLMYVLCIVIAKSLNKVNTASIAC